MITVPRSAVPIFSEKIKDMTIGEIIGDYKGETREYHGKTYLNILETISEENWGIPIVIDEKRGLRKVEVYAEKLYVCLDDTIPSVSIGSSEIVSMNFQLKVYVEHNGKPHLSKFKYKDKVKVNYFPHTNSYLKESFKEAFEYGIEKLFPEYFV